MNINNSFENLKAFIEKENFKGYDPYDALNSSLFKILSCNKKILRIVFIQTLKRLPFNLRTIFGMKKDYNPKGIGLFLWGYSKLYKIERKTEYLKKIDFFLELLEKLKSEGYSGNCWGYNFDWQSRAFYLPKYTPTIVNSSFIGHALIDTYKYTEMDKALDMAISIKNFILNDLNRSEEESGICFSYSPIDNTAVHNANLLGASLLIRLYKYSQDTILKNTALAALDYSMKYQREDGSWYYAETAFQKWIDSFHTGFNLQSILYFLEEGFAKEYEESFWKGMNFYKKNFFLSNGTPKYYHNKLYPFDIHSASQAIVLFSRRGNRYKDLAEQIIIWMIGNLHNRKGYFYYQRGRFFTNKIQYMRWAQAWAFHAFTEYYFSQKAD